MNLSIDYREGVNFFSFLFVTLKNHVVVKCARTDRIPNPPNGLLIFPYSVAFDFSCFSSSVP